MITLFKKITALMVLIPTLGLSGIGMVLPTVASAETTTCTTLTLLSDGSTQTAGYTQTNPATSAVALQPLTYSDGAFNASSPVVSVPGSWTDPTTYGPFMGSGAVWVSSNATSTEGNPVNDQWRLFRKSFSLPVGATVTSANIYYSVDNAAGIYLNGSLSPFTTTNGANEEVYGTAVSGSNNYGNVITSTFSPTAGANTLDFVVRNWQGGEFNPTGLLYKAVINYCVTTPDDGTSKVTIAKYIQGAPANSTTASSTPFLMSATWNASNIGSGTGQYSLVEGAATPYQTATADMTNGASYSTHELNSDGSNATTTCASGQRYVLNGYTTGNSLAEAAGATPTMDHPSFTNLNQDKYVIVWNRDCTIPLPQPTSKVTIAKYIEGMPATASSASSTPFLMSATWSDSVIGSGTGHYSLESGGATPYQASTINFQNGASYSTHELNSDGSNATTTCASGQRYVLNGYTTGNTWSEAMNATSSMSHPNFTNLTQDKYVIVWNKDCSLHGSVSTTSAKVHIMKYVNGAPVNASSTNNYMFPMMATWQAANLNGGATSTSLYVLGNYHGGAPLMYGADTSFMQNPYYYTTWEETGTGAGQVLPQGSACVAGSYRLDGYSKSSVSFTQAAMASITTSAPVWTNTSGDQYLIVHNTLCSTGTSTSTDDNVPLSVTVTPIKTSGIANNTYEDGWKYMFHVTAPSSETNLSMKFDNWLGALASSTILAGGNMRISSAQADNGGAHVMITAANAYSTPALHMNSDMNLSQAGRQVNVLVEVKIPTGTPNTSYTTNFGVQTLP